MQDSHSCDPGSIPGRCKIFLSDHFLNYPDPVSGSQVAFKWQIIVLELRHLWVGLLEGDIVQLCGDSDRVCVSCWNQVLSSLQSIIQPAHWPVTLNAGLLLVRAQSWTNPALLLVDNYYVLTESTERGRNFLEFRHLGASAVRLVIKNRFG